MNSDNHSCELKFIVSNNRAQSITKWLKTICVPDPLFHIGRVNSIYYDSKDWTFLYEKINSDYLKTKIRVRWYDDVIENKCYDQSYLEAKFKIGSLRKKVRELTRYSGKQLSTMRLDDIKLVDLTSQLYIKGVIPSKNIYPVFQISYTRLRFIDPYSGSRICFDYNISAPRVNKLMLSQSNPLYLNTAVFEIKGQENRLPFSLYPLISMGCRKSSFSKYSTCYQLIMERK